MEDAWGAGTVQQAAVVKGFWARVLGHLMFEGRVSSYRISAYAAQHNPHIPALPEVALDL